ncbi:hypothetical protein [Streptomyces longisporoflavus]|uniref:Uncharacterized protein n=1 Tax=Streptomyces longisporoflavus TaxID=28044 RepID=A0ABW7QQB7_9ACTN
MAENKLAAKGRTMFDRFTATPGLATVAPAHGPAMEHLSGER